jgi:hypothetical protein
MAMRTPVVENPIKAPEVSPEVEPVRFGLKIPEGATGGEIAKTVGRGAEEINQGLHEALADWEKQAEFTVQNKYETQLSNIKSRVFETAKVSVGTDAFGTVKPAMDQWNKQIKEIGSEEGNPRVADALNQLKMKYGKELTDSLQQHVAENIPKAYAEHQTALIQQKVTEARTDFNNPDAMNNIQNDLKRIVDGHAEVTHMNETQKNDYAQNVQGLLTAQVVDAMGKGNQAVEAQKVIEDARKNGLIKEKNADLLNKRNEPSVVLQLATDDWKKNIMGNKEYIMPNGTINKEKVESYLLDKYSDKTDRSFAIQRDVKTLMQNFNQAHLQGKKNDDDLYYNFFLQQKALRDKGDQTALSFEKTIQMRNDPRFGKSDEVDWERRRVHVVGLENPIGTKPDIYVRLHQGMLDGTTTREMITQVVSSGDLGAKDAMKLDTELTKNQLSKNASIKSAWAQITNETKNYYGTDTGGYNDFMYNLQQECPPNENANDLKVRYKEATNDRATGGFFSRAFAPKPESSVEAEQFKTQIGQEGFEKLGEELKNKGKDILVYKKEMETKYGDSNLFEQGKPGWEAIDSIRRVNQLPQFQPPHELHFTPSNIDWILNKSKNGVWNPQ